MKSTIRSDLSTNPLQTKAGFINRRWQRTLPNFSSLPSPINKKFSLALSSRRASGPRLRAERRGGAACHKTNTAAGLPLPVHHWPTVGRRHRPLIRARLRGLSAGHRPGGGGERRDRAAHTKAESPAPIYTGFGPGPGREISPALVAGGGGRRRRREEAVSAMMNRRPISGWAGPASGDTSSAAPPAGRV